MPRSVTDTIDRGDRECSKTGVRLHFSKLHSDPCFAVLVDFPRGYDLFAQRLPLVERLTQITGHRLDLIPEHELSRHLREAVLKEAVEL